ncbi:MAG: UDP-N-acetylglucosamine 2-epimerase (non-hydrolyzing) [Actinomycetia bacterium]|nr:UDP-N-acetylglucosamine 2-epimerase (non-hydrolyzing) [Actinomycetes bacterium]
MKVLSVVGARPQFVKLAPVSAALGEAGVDHVVVHTGQHYDDNMSQSFFCSLAIPTADINLQVGSGSHASQTAAMLTALGPVLEEHRPDWVLVYGDTNSTLAAAVVATKLHLPLARLEAGLRSFNRRMPEEHNRVLTDHSADLCLAPTEIAMAHLAAEGLAERSVLVGDVMTDILRRVADCVSDDPVESPIPTSLDGFVLATIHRPDNTDDPHRLADIVAALHRMDRPVFLAAHPRLVHCAAKGGVTLAGGAVTVVPPLAYPQLVQALGQAGDVVTDSGGLQKEAFLMGVPVVTVRTETEWVESLADGWNVLQNDPSLITEAAHRPRPSAARGTPYGAGDAAERTVKTLTAWSPP